MIHENVATPDAVAERIADRFRANVVQNLPIRAALVDDLAAEAKPAIHALLFALATDRAADATALEHHETTAMVTLLGRRFAMDDTTPTAALGVVPALLDAFRVEDGVAIPGSLEASLRAVFLEGYVRGREERIRAHAGRDVVARIPFLRPQERCVAIILRGEFPSEELGQRFEELARIVFAEEARACVVDLEGIVDPAPGLARALVALSDSLRLVGTRLVLSSMDASVRDSAESFGIDLEGIELATDFRTALDSVDATAGRRIRRGLEKPIRALLRARRGRGEKE